jgi:hypothetical protein
VKYSQHTHGQREPLVGFLTKGASPSDDGSVLRSRVPARVVACAALAGFWSLGVSACLQTEGQRKADFRERAEELLPESARVLVHGYGDCVELSPSPSCSSVVFELPIEDAGERADLMRSVAGENGWRITEADNLQGGWWLTFEKGGFRATVMLWRHEVYECEGEPTPEDDEVCFNKVLLERQ